MEDNVFKLSPDKAKTYGTPDSELAPEPGVVHQRTSDEGGHSDGEHSLEYLETLQSNTALLGVCAWSILCCGLALLEVHWALTLCVLPFSFIPLLMMLGSVIATNERNSRIRRKQHITMGKPPEPDYKQRLPALATLAAGGIFGGLGFWLVYHYLDSSDPKEEKNFAFFALELWFGGFALLGGALSLVVLVAALVERQRQHPARSSSSEEFDPNVGPQIPEFRHPVYPSVVACLVPHYTALAFSLFAAFGSFYSRWYLFAYLGIIPAYLPISSAQSEVSPVLEQLKLYFDWHDHHASGGEIGESLVIMKKEFEEVTERYERSVGWMLFIYFFALLPLTNMAPSTKIEEVSWGWLYFGGIFLLGNVMIYRQWREELWGLVRSQPS